MTNRYGNLLFTVQKWDRNWEVESGIAYLVQSYLFAKDCVQVRQLMRFSGGGTQQTIGSHIRHLEVGPADTGGTEYSMCFHWCSILHITFIPSSLVFGFALYIVLHLSILCSWVVSESHIFLLLVWVHVYCFSFWVSPLSHFCLFIFIRIFKQFYYYHPFKL